jgi:hypothetical protein
MATYSSGGDIDVRDSRSWFLSRNSFPREDRSLTVTPPMLPMSPNGHDTKSRIVKEAIGGVTVGGGVPVRGRLFGSSHLIRFRRPLA